MSLKTARRAATLKAALKAAAPKPAAAKAAPKNVATAVRSRAATMQGLNPRVVAALSARGAKASVPPSSFSPPPAQTAARDESVVRGLGSKKTTDPGARGWGNLNPDDVPLRPVEPRGRLEAAGAALAKAAREAAEAARREPPERPGIDPRLSGGKTSKPTGGDVRAESPRPKSA